MSTKPLLFEATRPPLLDARHTSKSYIALNLLTQDFKHRNPESVIELLVKSDKGILRDISTWCSRTGNPLISSEERDGGEGGLCCIIQKGVSRAEERGEGEGEGGKGGRMCVLISTAELGDVSRVLERAICGAVIGMEVDVCFEGSGIRLLKRGYRVTVSGFWGKFTTASVEERMRGQGWPLPGEAIGLLEELGVTFWVDGLDAEREGLGEEECVVSKFEVGGPVKWVDLMSKSDVCVVSRSGSGKS